MSQKCLTIHGHFYQPPRENPWTEAIDRQDSAHPFHDWNERITHECYTPNTYARVLDGENRIVNIVNNFELTSFNFGPTLLSWLEKNSPMTYQRILQADANSLQHFGGHGTAIAQAYNHTIMPLSSVQDQITQVRWGLADFRYRFGREPESMWMPETAVNDQVLRLLIDHGMKYLILSPYQAKRVRPFAAGEWQGVEHGEIDTSHAYRWFDRDSADKAIDKRHLDIFFYHGDLSRGVGFEHLVRDAGNFAHRIDASFPTNGTGAPQLVSIATDGESYGHHERFGERGLAYLFHVEVPRREIRITNYAEYLAENAPTWEVQLKEGQNGEGTAWSCAHGVGRWARNCGCRGGGPAHWTQEWRAPLRHALDELRDELNRLTLEFGEPLLKDIMAARNDYIHVILQRTPETLAAFFAEHQRKALSAEEKITAIKLMEMQRNMQLMYTSCGWFFTEISGIETVQVIQYAARAIQLAEVLSQRAFEGRFLRNLALAPSNMAEYKNGEGVFEKLVRPAVVSFKHVVNTYAIRSLFVDTPDHDKLYSYTLHREDVAAAQTEQTTLMIGLVQAHSGVTEEQNRYAYALVKHGAVEGVECHVRKADKNWDYVKHRDRLIPNLPEVENDLNEYLQTHWGGKALGLSAMLFEERQQVIQMMLQGRLDQIGESYSKLYEEYRDLIRSLRDLGATIPEELRVPTRYTLSHDLRREIEVVGDATDLDSYKRSFEIARLANRLGIELETYWVSRQIQSMLEKRLASLYEGLSAELCKEVLNLHEVSQRLKLTLMVENVQNQIFAILRDRLAPLLDVVLAERENNAGYDLANTFLQIAYKFGFSTKVYKDRLKAVEQELSEDPRFWP
ncbi:DUF3536 domain-containing protein [candidate division KSB1 bacterium]|nr:DUF3536 domain-containing protein [candidate division KSB1 bacterium]